MFTYRETAVSVVTDGSCDSACDAACPAPLWDRWPKLTGFFFVPVPAKVKDCC